MKNLCIAILLISGQVAVPAQQSGFVFGADLSYVNEMEDCGVAYYAGDERVDPYRLFAERGFNMARLRLWHTPAWYDTLNAGRRYSDLADVRKSIGRAKALGVQVLLDFHLSDIWADPSRQLIPAAWLGVADQIDVLEDSLYRYVYETLSALHRDGLWPEMIQIGNETNRGILLTPQMNDDPAQHLDWTRNARLFKTAIRAARDAGQAAGVPLRIALHIAGPANALWFFEQFAAHGIRDFDVIGLSYYWAWHRPMTIAQTARAISDLRAAWPGKEIMIFETGYIWTLDHNDQAPNIISETHPDYAPPSPDAQKRWLTDLTQAVIHAGGSGVMYWEPAWVSSPCFTPWGQGSHQEHATFFDFGNRLQEDGGIAWPGYPYQFPQQAPAVGTAPGKLTVWPDSARACLQVRASAEQPFACRQVTFHLYNAGGSGVASHTETIENLAAQPVCMPLAALPSGIYFVAALSEGRIAARGAVWLP